MEDRATIIIYVREDWNKNDINNKIREDILSKSSIKNIKIELYLRNYPFEDLKDIIIPNTVDTLYIENGDLKTLSGAVLPTSLKYFSCASNFITTLDDFVFPKHLIVFDAEHNKIQFIDSIVLPDTLEVLNLEGNPIETITNMNFPALHTLTLKHRVNSYMIKIITLINPTFNSVFNIEFNIKIDDDILSKLNRYYTRDQLIFLYLNINRDEPYQKRILSLI